MIGRVHGGPAQVGVLSSTIFGGVSGSAVADASAIGSMLIPWLKKLGYPAPFAAGTLAAAATIDILIPPSIPMIVYALVSGASIGALFVAGILPGLLMCAGFMAVCYVQGRRRNFPRDTTPFDWPAFWRQLAHARPGADDAGADHRLPALRHRHADRGERDVHAVRAGRRRRWSTATSTLKRQHRHASSRPASPPAWCC